MKPHKRIALTAVLLPLLIAGCTNTAVKPADDNELQSHRLSLTDYCLDNSCRTNHTVRLLTERGLLEQTLEQYWPAIMGDNLSLLPGDTLYIEAVVMNGVVSGFYQVDQIQDPDSTLVFEFSQLDMMLTVKNPFSQMLKFNADMVDFQGNLHPTSSCPVMAGGNAFEHWPHAIPELRLSNFRTLEATDSVNCEY